MTIKINKGVVKPEPIQAVPFAPTYDEAPAVVADIRAWLAELDLGFRVSKSDLKVIESREDRKQAEGVFEANRHEYFEVTLLLTHEATGYTKGFLLRSGDFLVAYLRPQGRPYPTLDDEEFVRFPLKVVRGYRINFDYDIEADND